MSSNNYDVGMKKICDRLQKEMNIDLRSMTALEFFARDGSWQTSVFGNLVKEVHAWEIDPAFEEKLNDNLPEGSKIRIGDSYKIATQDSFKNMFDMIVFDNPQGCYGNDYCEHFDALKFLPFLGKEDRVITVFNIKLSPYNFYSDRNKGWRERRSRFYGIEDTSNLDLKFVTNFYRNHLKEMGYEVNFLFSQKRPQENDLHYIVACLSGVKS